MRRSAFEGGEYGIRADNGGRLTVHNSVFGYQSSSAVKLANTEVEILYTTVILGEEGDAGVECTNIISGSIRNSLLLTAGDAPELDCPAFEVTDTVFEFALPDFDSAWFAADPPFGLIEGEFPPELAEAAVWTKGDPVTDIDGDLRPSVDGSLDFAGADIP